MPTTYFPSKPPRKKSTWKERFDSLVLYLIGAGIVAGVSTLWDSKAMIAAIDGRSQRSESDIAMLVNDGKRDMTAVRMRLEKIEIQNESQEQRLRRIEMHIDSKGFRSIAQPKPSKEKPRNDPVMKRDE